MKVTDQQRVAQHHLTTTPPSAAGTCVPPVPSAQDTAVGAVAAACAVGCSDKKHGVLHSSREAVLLLSAAVRAQAQPAAQHIGRARCCCCSLFVSSCWGPGTVSWPARASVAAVSRCPVRLSQQPSTPVELPAAATAAVSNGARDAWLRLNHRTLLVDEVQEWRSCCQGPGTVSCPACAAAVVSGGGENAWVCCSMVTNGTAVSSCPVRQQQLCPRSPFCAGVDWLNALTCCSCSCIVNWEVGNICSYCCCCC